MSRTRSKVIDRNRLTKKYPLIRAPKKNAYVGETELEIEVLSAKFKNESSKVVPFEASFPEPASNLRILISPRDTEANDSAMVSLAVDEGNTDVSQVSIVASAPFSGIVDIVILRVV